MSLIQELTLLNESKDFDKDHLDSFIEKAEDFVKRANDIHSGPTWKNEIKNACKHVNSDEPALKSGEIGTTLKLLRSQLKQFRSLVADIN
jgi:hypothetical protein